jgi:hypothetical protein
MSHAEDRNDAGGCKRAQPHVPFRQPYEDGRIENPERVQRMSQGQIDGMVDHRLEIMDEQLSLAAC